MSSVALLFGTGKRRSNSGKSEDLPDARPISKENLEALQLDFLQRCNTTGISEPDVHSEFVKRIAAAEKTGADKARFAVHSLRIGGACTLLHAGFSIGLIQR